MLQGGDGLDLAEEPLGADDRGELRAQHLDRDLAVVLEVVREIDGGHAAGAELALDAIAIGQGVGEAGLGLAHWVWTQYRLCQGPSTSFRGTAGVRAAPLDLGEAARFPASVSGS